MDKNINISNAVTLFRLMAAPVVMFAIILNRMQLALILFIIAALTDLFDGYISRKLKEETKLGGILDKISDKVLIGAAFAGLLVKYNMINWLFVFGVVVLIYVIGGVAFLKQEHKPILFGRTLISLQTITIVLFMIDFIYKWELLWITIVLTGAVGIVYVYRLAKEFILSKLK